MGTARVTRSRGTAFCLWAADTPPGRCPSLLLTKTQSSPRRPFAITILAAPVSCVSYRAWPFALVRRLILYATPANRRTYAPTCAQLIGSPFSERGGDREPGARAEHVATSRATTHGLRSHHWPRAGERQRQAGQARIRQALRGSRRNAGRRSEARVRPERGGDGRQRRVRLRGAAGWFVLHQRFWNERVPRACPREDRRLLAKDERSTYRSGSSGPARSWGASPTGTARACWASRFRLYAGMTSAGMSR